MEKSYPFVSQNTREIHASYFQGQILVCSYTFFISCTIPSKSPFPTSHDWLSTPFVLVCYIRVQSLSFLAWSILIFFPRFSFQDFLLYCLLKGCHFSYGLLKFAVSLSSLFFSIHHIFELLPLRCFQCCRFLLLFFLASIVLLCYLSSQITSAHFTDFWNQR